MSESIRNTLYVQGMYDSDPLIPCSFLPRDVPLPPAERECYIEIGPGYMPATARTWMTGQALSALNELGAAIMNGTEAVRFVVETAYRAPSAPTQIVHYSHKTRSTFYLVHVQVARAGRSSGDILYECVWASVQWLWQQRFMGEQYNVLTEDKTAFVAATASSATVPHSLQNLLSWAATAAGVADPYFGSVPATLTPPNNLSFIHVNASAAIGQLLRPCAWALRYDLWNEDANAFSVVPLGTDATEAALLATAAQYNAHDGDSVYSPQDYQTSWPLANTVPAIINVLFPKWPRPAFGTDPYSSVPVANASAAYIANTSEALIVGDHFDVSGKTYTEVLADIAAERAARWQARASLPRNTFMLNGVVAEIVPAKMVRHVRYVIDLDGAFTLATVHPFADEVRNGDLVRRGLMRAPAVPDIGTPDDIRALPRDDGVVDLLRVPPIVPDAQLHFREATSETFTTPAGTGTTTLYVFHLVAGGGGGAGGNATNPGGGGGAGEAQTFTLTGYAAGTEMVIATGEGGSNGAENTDGGNGGDSTITIGGSVVATSSGGIGGDKDGIGAGGGHHACGLNGGAGAGPYGGRGGLGGALGAGGAGVGGAGSRGSGGGGGCGGHVTYYNAGGDGGDGYYQVWWVQ